MSNLPTPKPPIDPAIAVYWSAAAEGRLVLPTCTDCGLVHWYPRPFCPDCSSRNIVWTDSDGDGEIYSFTITRRGQGVYRDSSPYVLAYVELDEGPRVLSNIVDADLETLAIGQRESATFDIVPDEDAALLRFHPT